MFLWFEGGGEELSVVKGRLARASKWLEGEGGWSFGKGRLARASSGLKGEVVVVEGKGRTCDSRRHGVV